VVEDDSGIAGQVTDRDVDLRQGNSEHGHDTILLIPGRVSFPRADDHRHIVAKADYVRDHAWSTTNAGMGPRARADPRQILCVASA
jgi:hypothetical protein